MGARAIVRGDGDLAVAAAQELAAAGFAVGDPADSGSLQVLVVAEAADATAALDAVRQHQAALATSGYGRVILLGSRDWLGWPGRAEQAAAAAALVGLTRSLALELGAQGTTVNLVCPPGPSSGGLEDPWAEPPAPLTGPVTDDDVAFAVGFLADERSGYFTGQVLHVSGGLSVLSSLTA